MYIDNRVVKSLCKGCAGGWNAIVVKLRIIKCRRTLLNHPDMSLKRLSAIYLNFKVMPDSFGIEMEMCND